MTALFIWLLDERGGKERVWAIGIALPEVALVEANEGEAFSIASLAVLRAWRNFDFPTELSLRLGAPCWVRNNTEMMTLGEMKAGASRGVRDVLCVRLDRSVSAGIVSDGHCIPARKALPGSSAIHQQARAKTSPVIAAQKVAWTPSRAATQSPARPIRWRETDESIPEK